MQKLKPQYKSLRGRTLREAGWEALVSGLGLVNATRFNMQSEAGLGDYTKIRKSILKGKRVADLYIRAAQLEKQHP